jgi:hypothetical protein
VGIANGNERRGKFTDGGALGLNYPLLCEAFRLGAILLANLAREANDLTLATQRGLA